MTIIVCSRWNCRRPPHRPFATCTEHLIEDLEAQITALNKQIADPEGSPTLWFRNAFIGQRKLLEAQLEQLRAPIETEPTLAPTTEDPTPPTPVVVAPAPSQPPRTEHTMAPIIIGALLLIAVRGLLRHRRRSAPTLE